MPRQNITLAVFDVRPIDPATGRVNFEFIESLKPEINLKQENKEKKLILGEISYSDILPVKSASAAFGAKEEILEELESTLSEKVDLNKELKLFGGKLISSKPRLRPSFSPFLISKTKSRLDSNYSGEDEDLEKFRNEFLRIFSDSAIKENAAKTKLLSPPPYLPWGSETSVKESKPTIDLSPAARTLDAALGDFNMAQSSGLPQTGINTFYRSAEEKASKALIYFAFGIASVFALTFLSAQSLNLKDSIFQRSNQAYINLNSVQSDLSGFNFFKAASSFALAARNFELLHEDLKKANSIFGVLDKITLGGTSDVSDLAKAGELISGAGADLAGALGKISEANLISIIQENGKTDILEILASFRMNLIQASRNLNEADGLIRGSDTSLIPESEAEKLEELKSKLPEFNGFIEKAAGYADALMTMLGQSNRQRYILLFQNTSELRPSGGFPGSYALIEFNKGIMEKFFVDDIYNPDGQMKEKIIPPKPLQKITPNWGMRDANWFVDFQTSAKKVAEFYYKDTGILVDGVIAFNVDLIPEIMKVTGPIEMADFGITFDSENFITEVQKEVEYERTKGVGQPKQILVEFGPKLLERLSDLSREDWMKIFAVLVSGFEKKDILGYFAEPRLQDFALENGLAGEIKKSSDGQDYLMIVHSNIMGSKTDAVIDNFVSLNIEKDSGDSSIHTLEIERKHKGGELGFYNKRNNDYVRVLLPEEAEIVGISGNDNFEFDSLLNYRQQGFASDPDLERYESRSEKFGSIEVLSEGGKKVAAFWMIVDPGQTKTVKLVYKTPSYKSIYFQKQPGLKSGFTLTLNGKNLFDENLSSDKNIGLE